MRVVRGLESLGAPMGRSVLTIGNFDGVHRAHQQLLAQAGIFAARSGGPVVVLTFEPHPLTVVAPAKAPPRLTSLNEKLTHLATAGADIVVVARSDAALLRLEPEQFVEDVIRRRFQPTHIVEGPSFGFGKNRRGTPALLRQLAAEFGCELHVVDPMSLEIEPGDRVLVSSSLVRGLVAQGRVRQAEMCLGRAYAITGEVVRGDQRGRTLGFPTANLARIEQLIPGEGVYVGRATVLDRVHPCAVSVGRAETFGSTELRVEAHLLDFEGTEIYGEQVRVEFLRFLRPQRKFESAEALVRQLQVDVQAVRGQQVAG